MSKKTKKGKEKQINHSTKQIEGDSKQFEKDLNTVLKAALRCVDYRVTSDIMTFGSLSEETRQLVEAYDRFRAGLSGQ